MLKLLVFIGLSILTGCATTKPLYYWGSYEKLLYDAYHKPEKATPVTQIEKITRDIDKAKRLGKAIPPGLYAHLGMMYAATGNFDLSVAALNEEKSLYPESAILIDGMLARAKVKQ